MKPHERLGVWEQSIEFVIRIYKMTESFPKEEALGLTSQMRKDAISVPTNIAAGAARQSSNEFLRFLSYAQGSASELATELLLACRLGYVSEKDYGGANSELDNIGRMICGLSRRLKQQNH